MKLSPTTLTLLWIISTSTALASRSLRGLSNVTMADWKVSSSASSSQHQRELTNYYYSTSDPDILGSANHMAAIGNPLKGLLTSPQWTGGNTPNTIPSSLEFHYVGLDQIMRGENRFDWSVLDQTLINAASRNNHVVWRVFLHYPGEPLAVPQYLHYAGLKYVRLSDGSQSPQYDDPLLLEAMQQFITAFGKRYDGHTGIGFIQLGLLGYWGEWHTHPDHNILSQETMDMVVGSYAAAFKITQLQCRQPLASVFAAGMGLHDDSFAYSTLGGQDWFFMNKLARTGQTEYWTTGAMGGETRPELQDIVFKPSYRPNSDEYKQDFNTCVDATHATYMVHHKSLFDGGVSGAELNNALQAHARLGYNFMVTFVGVSSSSNGRVTVDVTVQQTGVAPFYYPLNLQLSCPGTRETVSGVEGLVQSGSSKVFSFQNIPADSNCLLNTALSLESPFAYEGKKIKFAQGTDGLVPLQLPSPVGASASSTSSEFRPIKWAICKLRPRSCK